MQSEHSIASSCHGLRLLHGLFDGKWRQCIKSEETLEHSQPDSVAIAATHVTPVLGISGRNIAPTWKLNKHWWDMVGKLLFYIEMAAWVTLRKCTSDTFYQQGCCACHKSATCISDDIAIMHGHIIAIWARYVAVMTLFNFHVTRLRNYKTVLRASEISAGSTF